MGHGHAACSSRIIGPRPALASFVEGLLLVMVTICLLKYLDPCQPLSLPDRTFQTNHEDLNTQRQRE